MISTVLRMMLINSMTSETALIRETFALRRNGWRNAARKTWALFGIAVVIQSILLAIVGRWTIFNTIDIPIDLIIATFAILHMIRCRKIDREEGIATRAVLRRVVIHHAILTSSSYGDAVALKRLAATILFSEDDPTTAFTAYLATMNGTSLRTAALIAAAATLHIASQSDEVDKRRQA